MRGRISGSGAVERGSGICDAIRHDEKIFEWMRIACIQSWAANEI